MSSWVYFCGRKGGKRDPEGRLLEKGRYLLDGVPEQVGRLPNLYVFVYFPYMKFYGEQLGAKVGRVLDGIVLDLNPSKISLIDGNLWPHTARF